MRFWSAATVHDSVAYHVWPVEKAGWATAWWPSLAAEAARVLRCCARVGRAGAWSPRAARARDGAVIEGPVVASRRQGVAGKLEGTTGRAPGEEGAGGAH
jgi:hypothetical protein